ncbi:hypothetical protein JXR93_03565 [bacterium]|nr:hypothetical protein [bacterium]
MRDNYLEIIKNIYYLLKKGTLILFFSLLIFQNRALSGDFQTYNNYETQIQFFRLPNYSLNEFKEVVNIRVDDIFEIKSPYLSFKNWFSVEPSIGFDSLSQNSNGMKKNLLQLKEFSLGLTTDLLRVEIGRIYPIGYPPFDIINGASVSLTIKDFTLNYITGEAITESSFLGKVTYFDDFVYENYKYNSFFAVWSSDFSLFKVGFWQQKLDNSLVYDQIEFSGFLDYKNLSSSLFFKYSPTLERISYSYFDISYKNLGVKYQYDNPTFLFDSIWNLFYFEKKHLLSLFYNDNLNIFNFMEIKKIEVAFLNDISDWNVMGKILFLKKIFLNFDYVYNNYIYSSLDFDWIFNFKTSFRYSKDNNYYSESFGVGYSFKLYKTGNLNLSTTVINSSFYGLQAIGAMFLDIKI